ncbi:MAG: flavodoxin family protein [Methanomassiliicoccales archaeon]
MENEVLCVGGSPRKGGNTDTLIDRLIEGLREGGVGARRVMLRDYSIEHCIACERCRRDMTCTQFNDGMHLLYPLIDECRGLVLASPAYNYNVTSQMKTFIDRLYPYYEFTDDRPRRYSSRLEGQGRKAVVMGIGEQEDERDMRFTIGAMADPLEALDYDIVGRMLVTGHFGRGSVADDREAITKAFQLGRDLAASLD